MPEQIPPQQRFGGFGASRRQMRGESARRADSEMHAELQRQEDALIHPANQRSDGFMRLPEQDGNLRRPAPIAEGDARALLLQNSLQMFTMA